MPVVVTEMLSPAALDPRPIDYEGPGGLASITVLQDSLNGGVQCRRSIVVLAGCVDLREIVERPDA